jgi:hypothetical protein
LLGRSYNGEDFYLADPALRLGASYGFTSFSGGFFVLR